MYGFDKIKKADCFRHLIMKNVGQAKKQYDLTYEDNNIFFEKSGHTLSLVSQLVPLDSL